MADPACADRAWCTCAGGPVLLRGDGPGTGCASRRSWTCGLPTCTTCGNGVIDALERCDPPGGACRRAPCAGRDCAAAGGLRDETTGPGEPLAIHRDRRPAALRDPLCHRLPHLRAVCGDGIVGPVRGVRSPGSPTTAARRRFVRATTAGAARASARRRGRNGRGVRSARRARRVRAERPCAAGCTACEPVCGDGFVAAGEGCDPPGPPGVPRARRGCRADCAGAARAGTGASTGRGLQTSGRSCRCRPDCTGAPCAATAAWIDPEACGPARSRGGCPEGQCAARLRACRPICGDGAVGPGERCDPPGTSTGCPAGQVCRFDCSGCRRAQRRLDPGETCDRPDRCGLQRGQRAGSTAAAATRSAGDGVRRPLRGVRSAGAPCPPVGGALCGPGCRAGPLCGDGRLIPPEEDCDPRWRGVAPEGNATRIASVNPYVSTVLDPEEPCDRSRTRVPARPDGSSSDCTCQTVDDCGTASSAPARPVTRPSRRGLSGPARAARTTACAGRSVGRPSSAPARL